MSENTPLLGGKPSIEPRFGGQPPLCYKSGGHSDRGRRESFLLSLPSWTSTLVTVHICEHAFDDVPVPFDDRASKLLAADTTGDRQKEKKNKGRTR